jgi:hypothetical protein
VGWFRCRRQRPREVEPVHAPEPTNLDEARRARQISEDGLQHARVRDPVVRDRAGALRGLRQENHFAESMQKIFRERHT